jgi:hypothetical protein
MPGAGEDLGVEEMRGARAIIARAACVAAMDARPAVDADGAAVRD